MSVNYSTTAKTARLQAVLDLINAGAGSPKLKLRNSSNTVLVSISLDSTSAGTVGGTPTVVLTFDCTPALTGTAIADGTATNAIITDVADTTVVSGLTVGTAATDIILDSVVIAIGQIITITAATITHAADT